MQIAFKFDEDPEDIAEGRETVLFRAQMLRDVYYHEGDPVPSLEDFIMKPLSRPNGQFFWVYRQGTYIPTSIFNHDELYAGYALTAELEESPEPTFEGYHHIQTLSLEGGGKLSMKSEVRYSWRQQRFHLEELLNLAQRP